MEVFRPMQEQKYISSIEKRMRLWESCPEFILQMPLSKIFIVIGRQIDQSKTCGVKIRKISA